MELLYHQSYGKGQAIVLLHGFCEDHSLFRHYIPALSSHGWVIVADLGGFGHSAHLLPQSVSIESLAMQVLELLDHLEVEHSILVGHSLGGYVSLALAEMQPWRIRGLCLFHSTASADTEQKRQNRNRIISFVEQVGVEAFVDTFVPSLFYEGRREEFSELIAQLRQQAAKTPQSSVVQVMRAMRDRKDRRHVLATASYPIGFIIGKNDEAIPLESYYSQIGLATHSIVCLLGETGHMGMFERPQECLNFLISFIKQC